MKKFLSLCSTVLCGVVLACGAACGSGESTPRSYEVYAPDGAPALALVNAINSQTESDAFSFRYHVIDASTVQAQVTGNRPQADFCVLPVNLASKLLGTGETYLMLGTVTNGNLFFLTTEGNAVVTPDNATTVLVGKTVGVVQLNNVPGLTLQAVLSDYGVSYQTIPSKDAETAADKVNLLNLGTDADNVTPVFGCDYYLCPEPAATTKLNALSAFKAAGSLQELYGEGNGYPQAVLVAKKTVIESDTEVVNAMISYMEGSAEYLSGVSAQTVLNALEDKRSAGLTPSFNANNLNAKVIENCSVRFTAASDCKTTVNAFLEKLRAVNETSASAVSESFYYTGSV